MILEEDDSNPEGMTADEFIAARRMLGMTQQQLAALLGMTARALQDIENGRAKLRLVHVLAMEMILITTCAMRSDPALLHRRLKEIVLRAALTMKPVIEETK